MILKAELLRTLSGMTMLQPRQIVEKMDIPMLGLTTSSSSSSLMLALNSGPGNLGLQAMSMAMALLQIRLGMST